MKKLFYAPAAIFATLIFFVCEAAIVFLSAAVDACTGFVYLIKRIPKDFSQAYDEFLEITK